MQLKEAKRKRRKEEEREKRKQQDELARIKEAEAQRTHEAALAANSGPAARGAHRCGERVSARADVALNPARLNARGKKAMQACTCCR